MATEEEVRILIEAEYKRAEKQLKDVQRALRRIEGAAEDAGVELDRSGKKTERAADQLEGLKFAAQGAGGRVGEFAGRIENAGRAASIFAANPMAAAVAATAALAAGAALAGAATAAAFVAIVDAADDAREALEPFREQGLGLDQEDTDAVVAAAAAMEGVQLVAQQLVSELGAELAPVVEEVSTTLIAMGLTAVDVFNGVAEGADLGVRAVVRILEFGLNPLNATLITTGEAAAALARGLGQPLPKLEEWLEVQRENQTAAHLLDAGVSTLNLTLGDNVAKARELVEAITAEKLAREADTEAVKAQTAANRDLSLLMGESVDSGIPAFTGQLVDATGAMEEMAAAGRRLRNEMRMDEIVANLQGVAAVAGHAGAVFTQLGDIAENFADRSSAAAAIAFAAQKAAALAQIVVNTAVAATQALALPAPPPIPQALAITYGAIGAVQFGIAAAAQPGSATLPGAPSVGGGVGGGATGGGQGSQALTKPSGDGFSVYQNPHSGAGYRHRDLDVVASDQQDQPDGAFTRETSSGAQRRYRRN